MHWRNQSRIWQYERSWAAFLVHLSKHDKSSWYIPEFAKLTLRYFPQYANLIVNLILTWIRPSWFILFEPENFCVTSQLLLWTLWLTSCVLTISVNVFPFTHVSLSLELSPAFLTAPAAGNTFRWSLLAPADIAAHRARMWCGCFWYSCIQDLNIFNAILMDE